MTVEVMSGSGLEDEPGDDAPSGGPTRGEPRHDATATGPPGLLVLMLSACSVEALTSVAASWAGPVLVAGSAAEARAVLADSAPPTGGATDREGAVATVDVRLDPDRQVVAHEGEEVALTPLEFGFLSALLDQPGRVRRFEQLTEEVWGTHHIGDVTQVHSVVKRLRRKLKTIGAPVELHAVRGVGFRLDPPRGLRAVEP